MKPAHGRRGEDGFTLVELLIVLTISGLLTGLMVTGFRTAQSGWQRIALRDADHGACKALRQFLSNLLSQAYPAMIDGGAQPKVDFDGGVDEVTFLAPLPQRFGATDIVRYTLRFSTDKALHLAWRLDRRIADGSAHETDTDTILAAAAIPQGGLVYYGRDAQSDPAWASSWRGRPNLPELIDVRLAPCGDGTRDLMVAPLVTAASCMSQSSGRCGA